MVIRSIRFKLMLIMSAVLAVALSVAGAVMVFYELDAYRRTLSNDLTVHADLLGLSSVAALEFNDPRVAQENLALLKVNATISSSAIYTADGKVFATYVPTTKRSQPLPDRPQANGVRLIDNDLILFKRIDGENGPLGFVYLKARYDWQDRVFGYLGIVGGVMASSLILALLLSSWLQSSVTRPIRSISDVARRVIESRDFQLRAEKTTDDEIGILVDAFNNMLAEIGKRADDLELSNRALEREIADRRSIQAALSASERRHRSLVDAMSSVLWIANGAGEFVREQPSWAAYTGQSKADYLGLGWRGAFHPEDKPTLEQAWKHAMEHEAAFEIELRLWHAATQRFRYCSMRAVPQRQQAGALDEWIGSLTDVDARKTAEEALRVADRRKDEFLAMLAHELRNPLAPIRNAAQILNLMNIDTPMVRKTSDIIARQVDHMTSLIDDLLDVSRLTRGLVALNKRSLDLRDCVTAAIEQVLPVYDSFSHSLTTDVADEPLCVCGDETRLIQILANILNNAAKFTPAGGLIQLKAEAASEWVLVTVRDNGVGIDTSLLPHVFDLFVQGERLPDRAQGGLGLGLALVKTLVDLHDGQVEAQSDGVGRGSAFSIRLPRLRHTSSAPAPTPVEPKPRARAENLRIMIVDDNVDAANTLAALLQVQGHTVTVAYSGLAALSRVQRSAPEVLILDIGLPGMDGYELARRLRALPETARATYIALTGYGQEDDRKRSSAAGFDHHLVKPANPEAVSRLLANLA